MNLHSYRLTYLKLRGKGPRRGRRGLPRVPESGGRRGRPESTVVPSLSFPCRQLRPVPIREIKGGDVPL